MINKLEYKGEVDDKGNIHLPRFMRSQLSEWFKGHRIKVVVTKDRRNRSNDQNAYYWGVVIRHVIIGLIEQGYDLDATKKEHQLAVHKFLMKKFCDNSTVIEGMLGTVEIDASSSKLSTVEFSEYIEKIYQFASEFLGVTIPPPNKNFAQ